MTTTLFSLDGAKLQAFDYTTGTLLRDVMLPSKVSGLAKTVDGKFILAPDTDAHLTYVLDSTSFRVVKSLNATEEPNTVVASPDGKYIAIGGYSESVLVTYPSFEKVGAAAEQPFCAEHDSPLPAERAYCERHLSQVPE